MTPPEQIARLHNQMSRHAFSPLDTAAILAVCDLAERALLTDDVLAAAREALHEHDSWCGYNLKSPGHPAYNEWLDAERRLLPDERVEHRLDLERAYLDAVYETCAAREEHMASVLADDYHEKWRAWTDAQHRESVALRALWAAHAGIGGTE